MLDSIVPACQRLVRRYPDLPAWLILFNALPVSAFVALVLVAAVINFGIAIIFQVATIVISLIWLIPCVVFGSTAAFIFFFAFKKISYAYDKWRSQHSSPPYMAAAGDFSDFNLPTPPSSPLIQKTKIL